MMIRAFYRNAFKVQPFGKNSPGNKCNCSRLEYSQFLKPSANMPGIVLVLRVEKKVI